MIVIVTGGRHYNGSGLVAELERIHAETPIAWLLVGDCPTGADLLAYYWGRRTDGPEIARFVADWQNLGTSAGPRRNVAMVRHALWLRDESAPESLKVLCLAAPGGRGTADCVRRARTAGIEVREVLP